MSLPFAPGPCEPLREPEPIEGIGSEALAEGVRSRGHRMVKTVTDSGDLARNLRDLAAEGDLVVCMGAGDITKWAAGLAPAIEQIRQGAAA